MKLKSYFKKYGYKRDKNGIFIDLKNKKNYFYSHWEISDQKISDSKYIVAKNFFQSKEKFFDKPLKILDAGCGDGVHINYLLRSFSEYILEIHGVDISYSALNKLTTTNDQKLFLVNSSIDNLPYPNNFFDFVFSYGVIGYTDFPNKTVSELSRVLNKNGILGLWNYKRKKSLSFKAFLALRRLVKLLPLSIKNLICFFVVLFLPFIKTNSGINLFNSSLSQCMEIVKVNLLPDNLIFFDQDDINNWQKNNDLKLISKETDYNSITVWLSKK
tara:strand:- start:10165 stop:10980 length:816 start_codon:yes stop_codon:yes gene_type:complete